MDLERIKIVGHRKDGGGKGLPVSRIHRNKEIGQSNSSGKGGDL